MHGPTTFSEPRPAAPVSSAAPVASYPTPAVAYESLPPPPSAAAPVPIVAPALPYIPLPTSAPAFPIRDVNHTRPAPIPRNQLFGNPPSALQHPARQPALMYGGPGASASGSGSVYHPSPFADTPREAWQAPAHHTSQATKIQFDDRASALKPAFRAGSLSVPKHEPEKPETVRRSSDESRAEREKAGRFTLDSHMVALDRSPKPAAQTVVGTTTTSGATLNLTHVKAGLRRNGTGSATSAGSSYMAIPPFVPRVTTPVQALAPTHAAVNGIVAVPVVVPPAPLIPVESALPPPPPAPVPMELDQIALPRPTTALVEAPPLPTPDHLESTSMVDIGPPPLSVDLPIVPPPTPIACPFPEPVSLLKIAPFPPSLPTPASIPTPTTTLVVSVVPDVVDGVSPTPPAFLGTPATTLAAQRASG